MVDLVYIDPTDIKETPDDHLHILESIGAPRSALEAFEAEIDEEALARVPAPLRAEWEAMRRLLGRDIESRAIPTPPSIPTAVILAGASSGEPPPDLQEIIDVQAFDSAWQAMRMERMQASMPDRPKGLFRVAEDAGHFMHRDEPELVVEAIRQIVSNQATRR